MRLVGDGFSNIAVQGAGLNATGAELLASSSEAVREGVVSPDGHYLAYSLTAGGTNNIYVKPAEPGGNREIVSNGSGHQSRWSPSGRHLYYLTAGSKLVKKEHLGNITFGPEIFVLDNVSESYSIWPDESGILVEAARTDRQVWLETNLVERLKRIVPPIE